MRPAIARDVVKNYFVPHTTAAAASPGRAPLERPGAAAAIAASDAAAQLVKRRPRYLAMRGIASTIFWALLGHKTYVRAISTDRIPAALVRGSLAAGTTYLQERSAIRAGRVPAYATPKRSVFSLYALIGVGLGLAAAVVNRGRR